MMKLNDSFLGFTDNIKGIQKTKAENVLNDLIRYDGKIMKKKDFIFLIIQKGYFPKIEEGISYYSRKKRGYTKPRNIYILENENRSFFEITKTEYLFAKYLLETGLNDPDNANRYIQEEKQRKKEEERLKREQEEKERLEREERERIKKEQEEKARKEKIKQWKALGEKLMTEKVKNIIKDSITEHWEEIKLLTYEEKEKVINDFIENFKQYFGNIEFIKGNVHYVFTHEVNNNVNNKLMKTIYKKLFNITEKDSKRTITAKIKAFYDGREYKGSKPAAKEIFYIRTKNGFEGKEGIRLKVEDITCFIHQENGYYIITEAKSGMKITEGGTKKETIEKAKELITKNKDKMEKLINDAVSQFGLSPLYSR